MSKLLILSPTPTHPADAGNRTRIRKWLELCREAGLDYHFVFFRQEQGDERAMAKCWGVDRCTFLDYQWPHRTYTFSQRLRRRMERALGRRYFVPYGIDDLRCESLTHEVRKVADRVKPLCAQIEYVFCSYLFECFDSSVFKILDTHDIMAGRQKMYLKQGQEPDWFYTTKARESVGINRADRVVAIQEQERSYFTGLTRKPVTTVGHIVELNLPARPTTARPTVVFVGSRNPINKNALHFMLEEVWPLINDSVPHACLEVFGSVCESETVVGPGVRLAGQIASVSDAYDRAWLVVSPLQFGTGLKIKSIEAMGWGKALVATCAGCMGIENGAGTAFLRGDAAEEFAGHCIRILADVKTREALELNAYEYAAEWNRIQRDAFLGLMATAGVC